MKAIIAILTLLACTNVFAADIHGNHVELKCENGRTLEGEHQIGNSRTIECSLVNGKPDDCEMVTVAHSDFKEARRTALEKKEKRHHVQVLTTGSTLVFLNSNELTATIVQQAGMYQLCR